MEYSKGSTGPNHPGISAQVLSSKEKHCKSVKPKHKLHVLTSFLGGKLAFYETPALQGLSNSVCPEADRQNNQELRSSHTILYSTIYPFNFKCYTYS